MKTHIVQKRLAGILCMILASSCVMTREEGEQLDRDLRSVEQEIAVSKVQTKQRQKELMERVDKAEKRVANIAGTLEEAGKADADYFVKMDELVAQVQKLSGRLDEIEHRLQQLETSQPASQPATAEQTPPDEPVETPAAADTMPKDKKELYDLAKKTFDDRDYNEARGVFRHFLGRFPDDDVLSDNALYWTGESYFKEKTYDKAILTFQEVINKYPKSDKLDAALYKIGRSFEALGLKEDAVLFYEDLVAKYPKSHLVRDAKKRIKAARKKSRKRGRR